MRTLASNAARHSINAMLRATASTKARAFLLLATLAFIAHVNGGSLSIRKRPLNPRKDFSRADGL